MIYLRPELGAMKGDISPSLADAAHEKGCACALGGRGNGQPEDEDLANELVGKIECVVMVHDTGGGLELFESHQLYP